MSEKMYIYALSDDSGIRYIGQTNDMGTRLSRHFCDAGSGRDKTAKGKWLRSIMGKFRDFSIVKHQILEVCDRDNVNERERFWYNYYKKIGCDLVNRPLGL